LWFQLPLFPWYDISASASAILWLWTWLRFLIASILKLNQIRGHQLISGSHKGTELLKALGAFWKICKKLSKNSTKLPNVLIENGSFVILRESAVISFARSKSETLAISLVSSACRYRRILDSCISLCAMLSPSCRHWRPLASPSNWDHNESVHWKRAPWLIDPLKRCLKSPMAIGRRRLRLIVLSSSYRKVPRNVIMLGRRRRETAFKFRYSSSNRIRAVPGVSRFTAS
jgi:hypothetical protein